MNPNALYAADITRDRDRFIADTTRWAAGFPADVQAGIVFEAGERWDREHPQYARIEEAA